MGETAAAEPRVRTIGVMADELGQPVRRIESILRSSPHIKPVARAGLTRLYDSAALAMVRHAVNAADARRAQKGEPVA